MKAGTTRRRFFWKAGAALSAPLAVARARASEASADDSEALKARLRWLEDVSAIRELHRTYAEHLNAHAYDEIANLFANPTEATIDERIGALSADHFEQQDVIEISPDRTKATARIHCSVLIEEPIEPSCPLVEMAREQGGGVLKRWQRGVLENAYVRQDGGWKIERLAYRAT